MLAGKRGGAVEEKTRAEQIGSNKVLLKHRDKEKDRERKKNNNKDKDKDRAIIKEKTKIKPKQMRKKAQAEKLSSNMVLHINQQGWGASKLECQFSGKKKQNRLEA